MKSIKNLVGRGFILALLMVLVTTVVGCSKNDQTPTTATRPAPTPPPVTSPAMPAPNGPIVATGTMITNRVFVSVHGTNKINLYVFWSVSGQELVRDHVSVNQGQGHKKGFEVWYPAGQSAVIFVQGYSVVDTNLFLGEDLLTLPQAPNRSHNIFAAAGPNDVSGPPVASIAGQIIWRVNLRKDTE